MHFRPSLMLAAFLLLPGHAAAQTTRIPLKEGTVYTSAVAYPAGDEEHILTLTALDDQSATFSVAFRSLKDPALNQTFTRRVRREDLAQGHRINQVFQDGDPDSFPGSTFMHMSTAALGEIKRSGQTALVLGSLKDYQGMAAPASILSVVMSGRKYFRGILKRVGTGTSMIPVLVNGKRELLPAIETSGSFSVGSDVIQMHRWWLDDPDNAVILRSGSGKHSGQLVRIDFPPDKPQASVLAMELDSGDCRAGLNGIYFDTASADLLPQSKPALVAVAKLMREHPAWTIAIEGHTDNVGGGAFNLKLSQRRAASVRDALVTQFKVPASRLTASGFGASRPIAINTSLDGRAANRRVELTRSCP